jgi:hypothetical protein
MKYRVYRDYGKRGLRKDLIRRGLMRVLQNAASKKICYADQPMTPCSDSLKPAQNHCEMKTSGPKFLDQ